jgi:hypothetical protein
VNDNGFDNNDAHDVDNQPDFDIEGVYPKPPYQAQDIHDAVANVKEVG